MIGVKLSERVKNEVKREEYVEIVGHLKRMDEN
jgi:hypothetical protein